MEVEEVTNFSGISRKMDTNDDGLLGHYGRIVFSSKVANDNWEATQNQKAETSFRFLQPPLELLRYTRCCVTFESSLFIQGTGGSFENKDLNSTSKL